MELLHEIKNSRSDFPAGDWFLIIFYGQALYPNMGPRIFEIIRIPGAHKTDCGAKNPINAAQMQTRRMTPTMMPMINPVRDFFGVSATAAGTADTGPG